MSIDWFRATFKRQNLTMIRDVIGREFGVSESKKGRYFYERSERWAEGASVMYDARDGADHICVELPGGALNWLGQERAVDLVMRLTSAGGKPTRLDVAVDYRREDEPVGLLDRVFGSCRGRELCGARRFREVGMFGASAANVEGRTIYLGKRGSDGSGRFVRVYDKGLETGEAAVGLWERWECEFTGDCSLQVATAIRDAGDGWGKVAWQLAMSAVEFREAGQRRRDRRPLSGWYAELMEGVEVVQVKERREAATLEGWTTWLNRCVFPQVEAACARGNVSLVDVWRDLADRSGFDADGRSEADVELRPIVWQYLRDRGLIDVEGNALEEPPEDWMEVKDGGGQLDPCERYAGDELL